MSIFSKGKFVKLAALIGIARASITEEQVSEVNQELQEAGIEASLVNFDVTEAQQALQTLEAVEQERDSLQGEADSLSTAITGALTTAELDESLSGVEAVEALSGKIVEQSAEITRLGAQPGKFPAENKNDRELETEAENEFETQADREVDALRAAAGIVEE